MIPAISAFAAIGVGKSKAYALLDAGELPALKLGRTIMVRVSDWQRYLDNLPAYRSANERVAA